MYNTHTVKCAVTGTGMHIPYIFAPEIRINVTQVKISVILSVQPDPNPK